MDYGISEQLAELFRENAGNTLGAEIARRAALLPPNGQKPHRWPMASALDCRLSPRQGRQAGEVQRKDVFGQIARARLKVD